jgi:hypothetical protein
MEPKGRINRLIDAGLERYTAEPRAGLENRILARVREQQRERHPGWPMWMWAWTVAVGVIVLTLWLELVRKPQAPAPPRVALESPRTPPQAPPAKAAVENPPRRRRVASMQVAPSVAPHLAQFPSPMPSSEQERLLTRSREQQLAALAQPQPVSNEIVPVEIAAIDIRRLPDPDPDAN